MQLSNLIMDLRQKLEDAAAEKVSIERERDQAREGIDSSLQDHIEVSLPAALDES